MREFLKKKGAAKIILNSDVTSDNLNNTIEEIVFDKKTLEKMSKASKSLAVYDVEDRILKEIRRLVG